MRTPAFFTLTLVAALLLGLTALCQAATISGTVTNNSGLTLSGRIYVMLDHTTYGATGYGTSIAVSNLAPTATAAFSVRGVPAGSYTLRTFLDDRGTGLPYGASPVGFLTPVSVPDAGATVSGQNILLGSQGVQTLTAPSNVNATPIDNGVLVTWDYPENGNGIEIASHYNIYWSTTPNPSSTNTVGGGSLLNILSHNDGHAFIALTNGVQYYFAVEAVLTGANDSPVLSAATPQTTVGPAAGGQTVTATVQFDAAPSGRLLAMLMGNQGPVAGTYIATPTQNQTVTITGVPAGNYRLFLLLDKVNDGVFTTGDVTYSELDWRQPLVSVASAPVNLGVFKMAASRPMESSLATEHRFDGMNHTYQLIFEFYRQEKRPAHLTINSGPQMTVTDLGVNSWGEFWSSHNVATAPSKGQSYNITVTYTNGDQETFNMAVTDLITAIPNQTYPIGPTAAPGSTVNPWFSWNTLDGRPNAPYVYHVMLYPPGGSGDYLFEALLPPDQNSVEFTGGSLSNGTPYSWALQMIDSQGNRSTRQTTFTPQAGGPTITGISHFSMPCGNTTSITISGTGFSTTPANNSIYLNNTQYPITPTGATATSLTFQLPDCNTTPSPTGPVIINVTGQPSVGSHGEFTPTFSYSGGILDISGNPLEGVEVRLDATDPSASTTTDASGRYQLNGIPTGKPYRLSMSKSGLVSLYTAQMVHTASTDNSFDNAMGNTTYGTTPGKSLIRAVTRANNGTNINEVTVTAFSSRNNAALPVKYGTACASDTPLTDSNVFCVLNIEDGDWVTVAGSKPSASLTFSPRVFQAKANALGQSSIFAPVTFSIATAGAVMGFSFDGTNYLVGVENHTVSPTTIGAQMLNATGSKVGGLISTGRTGIATAVAFDGTNHLLIWEDNGLGALNGNSGFQIYGQFISRAGTKVGDPFVITTSGIWFDGMKVMAYGGGKYLVTYTRLINPADRDASTNRYIAGRLINPDGSLAGEEFRISTGYGDASDVAFDGTNFFVVWTEDQFDTEIRGRFVSPAGALVGSEIVVNNSAAPSDNPKSVTFDGTNYMVVWSDEAGGAGSGEWNVLGQRVSPAGALIGPTPITVTSEPGAQIATGVAFDGTNYLVSWTDMTKPINWEVYGQFVAKDTGALTGTKVTLYKNSLNQIGGVGFANGKYLALINNGVSMGENGITAVEGAYGFFRPALTPPSTPNLTTFSPVSGAAGTTVTIDGSNFLNGATSVTFNGVASTDVTYVSPTRITAIVPTGAGTGPVKVTTAGGSVTGMSNFTVTVPVPAPTISGFNPASGSAGDTITITGTNFVIGATTVSFNGTPSSTVSVSSATSLTAVVPAGATSGTISVTTAGGTATSGTSFTVIVDRTLTVSLASATYGTGKVTVTGRADCTASPCSYTIPQGAVVDLTPVPDVTSSFVAWTQVSGTCDSIISNVCKVTMNADKSFTANFSLKQLKNETKTIYYSTLLEALTAADSGNVIRAHDSLQAPSLSYNRSGVTVKIEGGYNNAFDQRNLPSMTYTDIASPLIIQSGTLILDQIIVK